MAATATVDVCMCMIGFLLIYLWSLPGGGNYNITDGTLFGLLHSYVRFFIRDKIEYAMLAGKI